MENSFMTHQDDREDYSVVHAKTPLIGFLLTTKMEQAVSGVPLQGKMCVMVIVSHSLDNWIQ